MRIGRIVREVEILPDEEMEPIPIEPDQLPEPQQPVPVPVEPVTP